jgi:cytoskeletal protein RodZ
MGNVLFPWPKLHFAYQSGLCLPYLILNTLAYQGMLYILSKRSQKRVPMSSIEAWIIIILVLGVIASNIAVLKYSAKFKMPQFGKPEDKPKDKNDSENLDDKTAIENMATHSQPQAIDTDNQETNDASPSESPDGEDSKKSHLL